MQNWLEYSKESIFRDTAKGGLLFLFLKDYQKEFGIKPIASCRKCLNSYWNNYLNLYKMENTVKCDYELHKKYNGIQLGVNGNPIRNGEMTNEVAKELLEKHPRGEMLFSKLPKEDPKKEVTEEVELSLNELRELHPNIKATSKKRFLELIEESK